eukprot:18054-Amphidinium_carterae.1
MYTPFQSKALSTGTAQTAAVLFIKRKQVSPQIAWSTIAVLIHLCHPEWPGTRTPDNPGMSSILTFGDFCGVELLAQKDGGREFIITHHECRKTGASGYY